MPADASIYGMLQQPRISSPLENYAQVAQIKNLMGGGELQALQLEQARRGVDEDTRIRDLFSRNPNPTVQEMMAISPKSGMAYQKNLLEAESHRATIGKTTAETNASLAKQGRDLIAAATPETLPAVLEWGVKNNQQWALKAPPQIMSDPAAFAQWQIRNVQAADEFLKRNVPTISERQTAATAPFTPGPNGPVPNVAVQSYEMGKSRASAPQVNVNTEKTFLGNVAEGMGKDVQAQVTAAKGAVNTIQNAHQIRQALDSGKVMAGPGTTVRMAAGQIAQSMGLGNDPESLVQTRAAIQGLAKLALDARSKLKGQGQISDFEGKTLTKAETGDISDLSIPELKAIADVAERGARFAIRTNNESVAKIAKNPNAASLVPYMTVDEPAEYKPKQPPSEERKVIGNKKYVKIKGEWFQEN